MSVFDVRGNGVGSITEIVFADSGYAYPHKIEKMSSGVKLIDCDEAETYVETKNILNLILALQKAVELGWGPKPTVKKTVVAKTK